jgi:ABC-type multidrug transport system fused ATPase/permease subunit
MSQSARFAALHGIVVSVPATLARLAGPLVLYGRIWRYAEGARRQYALAMAMLAGCSLLKLCSPLLAGKAINAIQGSDGGRLAHAGLLVAGVFAVQAAAWMLHGPGRVLERNVAVKVRSAAANALYGRLMRLPLEWHESRHSGELQHRVHQGTRALFDFTQHQFIYLQNAINIAGPLVALTLLSRPVGGLALCGFIALAFVTLRFDGTLMRLSAAEVAAERRYAATLLDFLGNVSTLVGLRLTEASRRLLDARLERVFEPLRRNIVVNEAKWCAVDLLGIGLCWSLVAVYAWTSRSPGAGVAIKLGSIFMVYQYAQQAAGVVTAIAANFQNFARQRSDAAGADPIWAAQPAPTGQANVPADWRVIEAHALEFCHAGGRGGLDKVALQIGRGERIALIGPSGAGKSTLLRVIAGLYEPQHGYYTADGAPLFGARHLSAIATLIPQEAEVFEATLRENLSFDLDHRAEAVATAAYVSCLDDVLAALPQGLDTPIAERGSNLSGGQRQRLALARGLLAAGVGSGAAGSQASSVLLLDEPTSALDPLTEAKVFTRLRESLPHTAVVASVHRLSLLANFDRVILMADGRIVDSGSVADLYERQALFREMMQFRAPDRMPAPAAPEVIPTAPAAEAPDNRQAS